MTECRRHSVIAAAQARWFTLMQNPAFSHRQIIRGFTLVELVTSLVILGLLAAYAAPRLIDQQPFRARGYADELAQALRHAREVAVATECPVQVNVTATRYSLLQRSMIAGKCTGAWTVTVKGTDGSPIDGSTPADVVVTPIVSFEFDSQGRPSSVVPDIAIDTFTLTVAGNGRVDVAS